MTGTVRLPDRWAARLNEACQCIWVDKARLADQVRERLGPIELPRSLVSGSVAFVGPGQAAAMDRTIRLITRAVASPAFEKRVVGSAPEIARKPQRTLGGILGFDFHLGSAEPQLIEINTNPGGLLVSLELTRAATAVCDCLTSPIAAMAAADVRLDDVAMRVTDGFVREWTRARGSRPLRTIAIVDDDPTSQYLYPEFLLYQRLFETAGIRAFIADATSLIVEGSQLVLGGQPIDLVYNRCTDFYFADDRHVALRLAYERDLAVITPHPAVHARWSDKRLLAWLRDGTLLAEAGLSGAERGHLQATIPVTEVVDPRDAEDLWSRRKYLFFKPAGGFGGKAAYRGDKLTRSTFQHVLAGTYVAQAFAPASRRRVPMSRDEDVDMRVDVRNFAMEGETWLRAARLYRGQTTNFRTEGGGFAPVVTLPVASGS